MSNSEMNPLKAIQRLKELSRSIAGNNTEKTERKDAPQGNTENQNRQKGEQRNLPAEKEAGRKEKQGSGTKPEKRAQEQGSKQPQEQGRRQPQEQGRRQPQEQGRRQPQEQGSKQPQEQGRRQSQAQSRRQKNGQESQPVRKNRQETMSESSAEKENGRKEKQSNGLKSGKQPQEPGRKQPQQEQGRRQKNGQGSRSAASQQQKTEEQKKLPQDPAEKKSGGAGRDRNRRKQSPIADKAALAHADIPKTPDVQMKKGAKIKIIPLGGLERIGMNITAFEYGDSIMVVDCGLAFPSDDMLGIDCVIPDITYLKENSAKVKGFVITHGHEDHIGALPYILKELNVPVYGTQLTIALIQHKLEEKGLLESSHLTVVKHGDTVTLGEFKVEFIKTNHSISDSSALAIYTPAGVVFHTGDFKIDYTPVFGEAADLQRMAELGKQGVLALMCDSTNAIRQGFTMSEKTVGRTFDLIFAEHKQNRIIVATFASNVDRVQQIINTADKYGRKVVVEGRSMVNVIGTAQELGYIRIPEGTLIDIEQLKNYPPEKTVICTTGSQGESMAALSRMASGMHKKVTIQPTDVIILSSHPIPGNEKAVDKVINELSMKGADVIFQDTHVSGHACAEEIKLMYSLLRPRFALPVHGEYRHLKAQSEIAEAVGIPKQNILIMSSGDVVELSQESMKVTGHVQAGGILVDGLGVGDVGNIVLRDRQNLAQNGIIIVTLALQNGSNTLVSGPDIVSRGFVYVKDSEGLMQEASEVVENAVNDCLDSRMTDWPKMKNAIRDSLSDFIWKKMKRNPMILPIIMGVD